MELLQSPFPVEVDLLLRGYEGPSWDVSPFRHREGWLIVGSALLQTPFGTQTKILPVVISDQGECFPAEIAETLMDIPVGVSKLCEVVPPDELEEALHWRYWDFLGSCDLNSLVKLGEADAALEAKITGLEAECSQIAKMAWGAMNKLRHDRRHSDLSPDQKLNIAEQLKRLETVPEEIGRTLRIRLDRLRLSHEQLEDAVLASLQEHGELTILGALRWKAVSSYAPSPLKDNEIRVGVPPARNQLNFIRDDFARTLRRGIDKLERRVGSLINSIEYDETLSDNDIKRLKRMLADVLTGPEFLVNGTHTQ